MDPLTAVSTTLGIFTGILSFGSSAPDPSKTAIFETYEAVQIVDQRVASLQGSVATVHETVIDLGQQIGQQLDDQTDIEATERLETVIKSIPTSYRAFLANMADVSLSVDTAESEYLRRLKTAQEELDWALGRVIGTAPYSLELGLAGTAFELYINRRTFPGLQDAVGRAKDRIKGMRISIEGPLAQAIEVARMKMEHDRVEAERLLSITDWRKPSSAIVFSGSYYSAWHRFASFQCMMFDSQELHAEEKIFYLSFEEELPTSVVKIGQPQNIVGDVCGASITTSGPTTRRNVHVNGQAIGQVAAPDLSYEAVFDERKRILLRQGGCRTCAPWTVTSDVAKVAQEANTKYQATLKATNTAYDAAVLKMRAANISAARYALLLNYRDKTIAAIDTFESNLDNLATSDSTAVLDQAFGTEVADLKPFGATDIYTTLRGYELLSDENAKLVFRNTLVEAAIAADERMAASMQRVQEAIQEFENGSNLKKQLQRLSVAVAIYSSFAEIGDALVAPSVETSKVTANQSQDDAASAVRNSASQVVPSTRDNSQSNGIPKTKGMSDYDLAKSIISELRRLGPPKGEPSRQSQPTRRELLAEELTNLLNTWTPTEADKLYESYTNARIDAQQGIMKSAWDQANPLKAARIMLREALTPTMTSPAADTNSIYHRDKLRREALPYLKEIRDWRLQL